MEKLLLTFYQFKFGALSLFSLTLDHLEFSWSTLALDQGRKPRIKEQEQDQAASTEKIM